jgi:glutathione S-transferase
MTLTLISHALCPYVQRAAIVLHEKGLPFERVDVDLANKPDWFRRVSPLGKTPVLLADGVPIFESAVICEYLEDTRAPSMHPADPLRRAQHRGWMEFASSMLNDVSALYNAPDRTALALRVTALRSKFTQLEQALGNGPWFDGAAFSIVDAAFGPLLRYFDVLEQAPGLRILDHTPRVAAWREALAQRASVRNAVHPDYSARLRDFLLARKSALSDLLAEG